MRNCELDCYTTGEGGLVNFVCVYNAAKVQSLKKGIPKGDKKRKKEVGWLVGISYAPVHW